MRALLFGHETKSAEGSDPGCGAGTCEALVVGQDSARAACDRGLQHDCVGEAQTRPGAAKRPPQRRRDVIDGDVEGSPEVTFSLLSSTEPGWADQALGKGERGEQDLLVTDRVERRARRRVTNVLRVPDGDDPAGVGDDHAGQSSARS